MLIIGSQALRLNEFEATPKDLDLVMTYDNAKEFSRRWKAKTCYPINQGKTLFLKNAEGQICEIEIAWENTRAEKLLKFQEAQDKESIQHSIAGMSFRVATTRLLLLLKMSHRYLKDSSHFLKTMNDIHKMREQGIMVPDAWQEFYEERMRDTYTYKHPKLDVKKDEFFDSEMTGVWQKYDHDSIHLAVAIDSEPAYKAFQSEKEQVLCSKKLFDNCSAQVRMNAVVEESMVLALERSLIPFPGAMTPEAAFLYALQKVCTSITSGWFREYAWENYFSAKSVFEELQVKKCFTKKFQRGINSGIVKLMGA